MARLEVVGIEVASGKQDLNGPEGQHPLAPLASATAEEMDQETEHCMGEGEEPY
jgi:hypothetical protein